MQEEFLHYVWKHQKLNLNTLLTTSGERLELVSPGQQNFDAGPDFFDARIRINGQLWAGNVEIHLHSSDWYSHNHHEDSAYQNVILHVVWEHDMDVFMQNEQPIPTLELYGLIAPNAILSYEQLKSTKTPVLPCVSVWADMSSLTLQSWFERLYVERLEVKYEKLLNLLNASKNDWEAVLFQLLLKNFGLKTNGPSFEMLARTIPFKVIQKLRFNPQEMEALLLGQSGLLPLSSSEASVQEMIGMYNYLKRKFDLNQPISLTPKYFRLRPSNFPTIKLSQFAQLWCSQEGLFSQLIEMNNKQDFYITCAVGVSPYRFNHFTFEKISKSSKKKLTPNFVDLLMINTIIPIKFAFQKYVGNDPSEELLGLIGSIQKEDNSLIRVFDTLELYEPSALHSQAMIHLKTVYCDTRLCLKCAIGNTMLSNRFN